MRLPILTSDHTVLPRKPAALFSWDAVRRADAAMIQTTRRVGITEYEHARRDIDAAMLLLKIGEGLLSGSYPVDVRGAPMVTIKSLCEEYPDCRAAWNKLAGQFNTEALWSIAPVLEGHNRLSNTPRIAQLSNDGFTHQEPTPPRILPQARAIPGVAMRM